MKKIEPKELYARLAKSMGKTLEEVEQSMDQLIGHIWPLLAQEDRDAMSAGQYPTKEQFLRYLPWQTQLALERTGTIQEEQE